MKPTDDASQFPENGMSTTPRTDEQVLAYRTKDGSEVVHASTARELETELAHLNDEVERLKKDNLDMSHWIGSKMYEPEWNSFKKSLKIIDHWKARAEKAEAQVEQMKDYAYWKDAAKTRAENLERASEQMLAHEDTIIRLRAENERLKDHAFDTDGTPWKTVCGWWAKKYDAAEQEMMESAAHAASEEARAELARLRAEKAEADTARLDWIERQAGGSVHSIRSFIWFAHQNLRAAIDAAMKEPSK